MGYTHYFETTREFSAAEWQTFTRAARKVFSRARKQGIALAGWNGAGKPTIDSNEIRFNGAGADSFETATFSRAIVDFEFCKTGRRPYDAAVVALCIIGARIGPLTWRSDGDGEDHDAGTLLAKDLP